MSIRVILTSANPFRLIGGRDLQLKEFLEQLQRTQDSHIKELSSFLKKQDERSKVQGDMFIHTQTRLQSLITFLEKEIRQSIQESHKSEQTQWFVKWIHKSKTGDEAASLQQSQINRATRQTQLQLLQTQLKELEAIRDTHLAKLKLHASHQASLKQFVQHLIPHLKRFKVESHALHPI
jgi:hypothetical protein